MHYSWETHVPLAVKFCYTRLQCGLYMHYSPVSFAFMSFINTRRMLGSLTANSLNTILDKDIGPVRTKDAYTQRPASRLRRASCREHTAVNKSTTEQWRRHSHVECFQTIMNRRYFSGQGPTSQRLASWRVGRIYTNVHHFANTGMPSHLSRALLSDICPPMLLYSIIPGHQTYKRQLDTLRYCNHAANFKCYTPEYCCMPK
jgi:hypothetical protein